MNVYTITFDDGSHTAINARTSDEAIHDAQEKYRKAVIGFTLDSVVEAQAPSTFESLKRGGPNL